MPHNFGEMKFIDLLDLNRDPEWEWGGVMSEEVHALIDDLACLMGVKPTRKSDLGCFPD